MKSWVRTATQVKRMMVANGTHEHGTRYGKAIANVRRPHAPQWKGGPVLPKLLSPLLRALMNKAGLNAQPA